jgi:DMSO/TMAO reductase YedYZ molybdopterin-dependent catalytic subunit
MPRQRRPEQALPPGQRERADFPRFGLPWQVKKVPSISDAPALELAGDGASSARVLLEELQAIEPVEQVSDFHCVTTWSCRRLRWSGWRFRDVYERVLLPRLQPPAEARIVIFKAHDGYMGRLLLEDALAEEVLLADRLAGEPLSLAHGRPLRLVAPSHYGYKSVKHLSAIELRRDSRAFRPVTLPGQEHLRARVSREERGRLPAWLLRLIYRPFIAGIVRRAERALRVTRLHYGDWELEVDVEATRRAYTNIAMGDPETCGCLYCRNFAAAQNLAYPTPVLELYAQLGIEADREAETYEAGPWEDDPTRRVYGGWHHFIGRIVKAGEHPYEPAPGFHLVFSERKHCADPPFKKEPAVVQAEFVTALPWVVAEKPEP